MLRRLAAVAAWAVFLAAVPTGSLYVTTLPSGADVWVDGTYVGRSPLVLDALATGHHAVGITKTGWDPLQLDVSVVAGQTTLSSTRLAQAQTGVRPALGSIALHGEEADATYLDGVPVSPAKDGTYVASAGTHRLVARTAHGRLTRSVTVWPQTRTDVLLQPDTEPPRPSVVAPAEDYVPRTAIRLDGTKVVIRYGGHEVVGRIGLTTYRLDGKSVDYGEAPTLIGNRLYLPLDLLTTLSQGAR
ncbi:MAG: PEGA domain-containing protein [Candidatus Eremiobacteraeota bacterium]|nr:PEGA domain-containing protein [Candidatus Eremiobacteraeota bacterium]MBV8644330.1 PEGA domain-containing protein [Candidatus Eremiobacteraeota bacterium]